jgi:hypothetical protein
MFAMPVGAEITEGEITPVALVREFRIGSLRSCHPGGS